MHCADVSTARTLRCTVREGEHYPLAGLTALNRFSKRWADGDDRNRRQTVCILFTLQRDGSGFTLKREQRTPVPRAADRADGGAPMAESLPRGMGQKRPVVSRAAPAGPRECPWPSRVINPVTKEAPLPSRGAPAGAREGPSAWRGINPITRKAPLPSRGSPAVPREGTSPARGAPAVAGDTPSPPRVINPISRDAPPPSRAVPAGASGWLTGAIFSFSNQATGAAGRGLPVAGQGCAGVCKPVIHIRPWL